jgi:hypothetical protein
MPAGVATEPLTTDLEIFKTGTHTSSNGTTLSFTQSHLQEIADSYDPNHHEAPVIVGHAYATSPAYGWIESLKTVGDRLVARVKQIEPQFAELVRAGRFKRISAGLYTPESPSNPYPGKFSLREVSFLGAQPPAIKGLKPVEFAEEEGVLEFEETLSSFDNTNAGNSFELLERLLIRVSDLEAKVSLLPIYSEKTMTIETKEAEFAERQRQLEIQQAELAKQAQKLAARQAEFDRKEDMDFAEGLVKEGKALPAEKENLVAMMRSMRTSELTVSFGENDNPPMLDAFKTMLSKRPPIIPFGEHAKPEDKPKHNSINFSVPEGLDVDTDALELHDKALAYMDSHKGISYIQAISKVGG